MTLPHPQPRSPEGKGISPDFQKHSIVAVIPCYRVEREIQSVLQEIPPYIKYIVVVDDASPDSTRDLVTASAKIDSRILLMRHPANLGVGGAMITGYKKALELGAEIVVKIDGDGQMDVDHLPVLMKPLLEGKADYTKGNRFRDFRAPVLCGLAEPRRTRRGLPCGGAVHRVRRAVEPVALVGGRLRVRSSGDRRVPAAGPQAGTGLIARTPWRHAPVRRHAGPAASSCPADPWS